MTFDSKKYYLDNKERMTKQILDAQNSRRIKKLLEQLNKKEYKRFPYAKIDKYNIKINENGLYYI